MVKINRKNMDESNKNIKNENKEEVENNKNVNKEEIGDEIKNNTVLEDTKNIYQNINNNKLNNRNVDRDINENINEDNQLNTQQKVEKTINEDPTKVCDFDDIKYYHREGDKTLLLDKIRERVNYIIVDEKTVHIKNIEEETINLFTQILEPLERKDIVKLRRKMDYEKEDITLQIENEEKNKTKKILRKLKRNTKE